MATLSRLGESRKSMPRGRSSVVEVAIETMTATSSRPWNLSTVPTLMFVILASSR